MAASELGCQGAPKIRIPTAKGWEQGDGESGDAMRDEKENKAAHISPRPNLPPNSFCNNVDNLLFHSFGPDL